MEYKSLLYQQQDNIAIITLNRPTAYNTITKQMSDELIHCFSHTEKDETIKAMILTGSGPKAFCAGLDLKELSKNPEALKEDGPMLAVFAERKKPLLGAINGYAITGGLELALMCDLLYASENA
ncbi:MAG: enoyl-CoA hydratase-related protein, partial [Bacteroidota bacterium]